MSRRRASTQQHNAVVVGWTEVWSTTPHGFAVEGVVPLTLPRIAANGKSLTVKHSEGAKTRPLLIDPECLTEEAAA